MPFAVTGGEGGIRTHGTDKGSTVFKTAAFDHSATSPIACFSVQAPEHCGSGARILLFPAAELNANWRVFGDFE
jgi:hypothetical protein